MKFDLNKAINDEEYARSISITEISGCDICYDDYIFILSALYASGISFDVIISKLQSDEEIFKTLLYSASVIHYQDWYDAVCDVLSLCKLELNLNEKEIKSSYDSRKWIRENVSPTLLKILHKRGSIEVNEVIYTLQFIKR